MRNILFEVIEFEENVNLYSTEEQKQIILTFRQRIKKATNKVSVAKLIDKINNV